MKSRDMAFMALALFWLAAVSAKALCTYDEIVSSDVVGEPCSALVDCASTSVMDSDMAKVVAWYDNEWGYSCRVADLAAFIGARL